MSATKPSVADDLFEQAANSMQSAIRYGLRLQEESTRWFAEMARQLGSNQQWPQRTQSALDDSLALAQKNSEEAVRLMSHNADAGVALLRKAIDAWQAESGVEAQSKSREVWESALEAMRVNAEAVVAANQRGLERWSGLAQQINGDLTEHFASMSKTALNEAERLAREVAQHAESMTGQPSGNGA